MIMMCATLHSLPFQNMLEVFTLSDLVAVIDSRGRTLSPCRRKVAEREVRLARAKWIGRNKIRLRFDPFAYRYIRLKILARDQYTCYWCGGPGDTMDHVIPWSKGGRTTMNNCICACSPCNGERGDMPAEEFARRMNVPPPREGLLPVPAALRPHGGVVAETGTDGATAKAVVPETALSRAAVPKLAVPQQRPLLQALPKPGPSYRLVHLLLDPLMPHVRPSSLR